MERGLAIVALASVVASPFFLFVLYYTSWVFGLSYRQKQQKSTVTLSLC